MPGHGGEREQRGCGDVVEVRPEAVAEAQRRDRDVGVAVREALDGVVGLDDVGLQAGAAARAGGCMSSVKNHGSSRSQP